MLLLILKKPLSLSQKQGERRKRKKKKGISFFLVRLCHDLCWFWFQNTPETHVSHTSKLMKGSSSFNNSYKVNPKDIFKKVLKVQKQIEFEPINIKNVSKTFDFVSTFKRYTFFPKILENKI